jgi:hyperosmotically inducible protein
LKNITSPIIAILLMLASTTIFAEQAGYSTSSSTTKTTTSGNKEDQKSTETTTYTTTTSTSSNSTDDDIVSAVYAKFAKDGALFGTSLNVSSQDGIVTVSGTVTSQSQADEASIAAKSVAGVKDVRSSINVTTNPHPYQAPKVPNY